MVKKEDLRRLYGKTEENPAYGQGDGSVPYASFFAGHGDAVVLPSVCMERRPTGDGGLVLSERAGFTPAAFFIAGGTLFAAGLSADGKTVRGVWTASEDAEGRGADAGTGERIRIWKGQEGYDGIIASLAGLPHAPRGIGERITGLTEGRDGTAEDGGTRLRKADGSYRSLLRPTFDEFLKDYRAGAEKALEALERLYSEAARRAAEYEREEALIARLAGGWTEP